MDNMNLNEVHGVCRDVLTPECHNSKRGQGTKDSYQRHAAAYLGDGCTFHALTAGLVTRTQHSSAGRPLARKKMQQVYWVYRRWILSSLRCARNLASKRPVDGSLRSSSSCHQGNKKAFTMSLNHGVNAFGSSSFMRLFSSSIETHLVSPTSFSFLCTSTEAVRKRM